MWKAQRHSLRPGDLPLQPPLGPCRPVSELGRGQGGLEAPVVCGQVAQEAQRRTKSRVWPLQDLECIPMCFPSPSPPPTLSACSWCALKGGGYCLTWLIACPSAGLAVVGRWGLQPRGHQGSREAVKTQSHTLLHLAAKEAGKEPC